MTVDPLHALRRCTRRGLSQRDKPHHTKSALASALALD
jgi:hypothetical protein